MYQFFSISFFSIFILSSCGTTPSAEKISQIHAQSVNCKNGISVACHKAGIALQNLCDKKVRSNKTCPSSILYYKKGCELGFVNSCTYLAHLYRKSNTNLNIVRDDSLYVKYAEKSFNLGSISYAKDLKYFYKIGKGVKKDYSKYIYYQSIYNDNSKINKFSNYSLYKRHSDIQRKKQKAKSKSRSINFGRDKYGLGIGAYAWAQAKCKSSAEFDGINYRACYWREINRLRAKAKAR